MTSQDNRDYTRTDIHPFVDVSISSDKNKIKKCHLQNISRSGAFLSGCSILENRILISIKPLNKGPIIKKCVVIRKNEKEKWLAVIFEQPLTEHELNKIIVKQDGVSLVGDLAIYDFAKTDRSEVFRENQQIKTCSSNVFIWAMGAILPLTLGIWALFFEKFISVSSLFPAMTVILLIFCVAVFSNIEKARAINKREGFMAALDYYLNKGQGPQDYRGWINLKHCFAECKARRRSEVCPRRLPVDSKEACKDIGERKAVNLLSTKRVIPTIFDSFISLTSVCYGSVFIFLVSLFGATLALKFKEYEVNVLLTISMFLVGFLISLGIWRYTKIVFGMFVGVILTYALGGVFTKQITYYISIITANLLGMVLGSITWVLVHQVLSMRVGKHSFESYVHTWFEIYERCVFMPDEAFEKHKIVISNYDKFANGIVSFFQK